MDFFMSHIVVKIPSVTSSEKRNVFLTRNQEDDGSRESVHLFFISGEFLLLAFSVVLCVNECEKTKPKTKQKLDTPGCILIPV